MSLDQEINYIVDMKIQQLIDIIVRVSPLFGSQVVEEYRKLIYYQAKKSVQVEVSAFDTIIDPNMGCESSFSTGKGILTPSDVHFDYACEQDDARFNFKTDGYVPDDAERQQVLKDKPFLFGFDESVESEIEAQLTELETTFEDLGRQNEENQLNKKYDLVMSDIVKKG